VRFLLGELGGLHVLHWQPFYVKRLS
jgi:hypothetical protein